MPTPNDIDDASSIEGPEDKKRLKKEPEPICPGLKGELCPAAGLQGDVGISHHQAGQHEGDANAGPLAQIWQTKPIVDGQWNGESQGSGQFHDPSTIDQCYA